MTNLIQQQPESEQRVENNLKVITLELHYYIEKRDDFIKDAAGLGCIGKRNMIVTSSYGPRIRLSAPLLDVEVNPTEPVAFAPCADCKRYCRKVCPENTVNTKLPLFESFSDSLNLPARD